LQSKVQTLESINQELDGIKERYMEEVKEHHRLNINNDMLRHKVNEKGDDSSMSFFDTLRDRFITYLSCYLD
jgi:regulator of replication initiation timing